MIDDILPDDEATRKAEEKRIKKNARALKHYHENRDVILKKRRERSLSDEKRAAKAAYMKIYYAVNAEHLREMARKASRSKPVTEELRQRRKEQKKERRRKNPEKYRELDRIQTADYRKRNPEKYAK